jgi:hypothetical protein
MFDVRACSYTDPYMQADSRHDCAKPVPVNQCLELTARDPALAVMYQLCQLGQAFSFK